MQSQVVGAEGGRFVGARFDGELDVFRDGEAFFEDASHAGEGRGHFEEGRRAS